MISAAAPILIAVAETRAAVLLNLWCEKRRPPANADAPSTSNRLPMIDPVSDAFTTVVSPFESAISAIISSAALPKVALRNPPMPAPVCAAICSVARPNQPARGIMPAPATTKSNDALFQAGTKRIANATGTASTSQSSGV